MNRQNKTTTEDNLKNMSFEALSSFSSTRSKFIMRVLSQFGRSSLHIDLLSTHERGSFGQPEPLTAMMSAPVTLAKLVIEVVVGKEGLNALQT